MAIAAVAGLAAAGVGAASAAGAFSPSAASAGPYFAQDLQAQIGAIGPTLTANKEYDPQQLALNQQLAYNSLFGSPAGSTVAATPGYYQGPGGARSATLPTPFGTAKGAAQPSWTWVPGTPGNAGNPATPGSLALMSAAAPGLTAIQTAEQAQVAGAQIGDVAAMGPAARSAIAGYNPGAASLLSTLTNQANTQLSLNGRLDPATNATLASNLSGAQGARGGGFSPADANAVAYYQTANMTANRAANQNFASNVIGQNQQFYGDPFMQVLGRSSGIGIPGTNYSAPASATVMQQGSTNPAINNLAMMGYGAQNAANAAGYNSQMQGLGALAGNGGQTISNLLSQIGLSNLFSSTGGQGAGTQGVNFD